MTTRQEVLDYCRSHYNPSLVSIRPEMVACTPPITQDSVNGHDFAFSDIVYCALQFKFWHTQIGCMKKLNGSDLRNLIDRLEDSKHEYITQKSLKDALLLLPDFRIKLPWSYSDFTQKVMPILKELSTRRFSMAKLTSLPVWQAIDYLEEVFPRSFGSDPLHKKSQLCVAHIDKSRGRTGYKDLTGLADYRLPQILRSLKVLQYSPEVARFVDYEKVLGECNSDIVQAIRCAAVIAMEMIAKYHNVSPVEVDMFYFNQRERMISGPFHLHDTTWY